MNSRNLVRYVALAVVAFILGGYVASLPGVRRSVDATGINSLSLAAGGGDNRPQPPVTDRAGKLSLPNTGPQHQPVAIGQADRLPDKSSDAPGQIKQGSTNPNDLPKNAHNQHGTGAEKVANQVIAVFHDHNAFATDTDHKKVGKVLKENVGQNARLLEVTDTEAAKKELKNNPNISAAEDNFVAYASFVPNDSFINSQYAVFPWWQTHGLRLTDIWNYTTGTSGIRIALLDTGLNWNHPDLAGKNPLGYNFAESNYNWGDCAGHGTFTAGVAGAVGNNGIGISGADMQAQLYEAKIVTGCGTTSDYFTMGWALDSASQWYGTKTVNISFGGYGYSSYLCQAVSNAVGRNVAVVASAGNDNTNSAAYPAACPNAIAVGATDQNGARASFSNWGWPDVYVAAPGVSILSTTMDGWYGWWDGTSFSAPEVAGIVSLTWSRYPSTSVSTIQSWLRYYSYNPECGWGCYTNNYGYGVPDAYWVAI